MFGCLVIPFGGVQPPSPCSNSLVSESQLWRYNQRLSILNVLALKAESTKVSGTISSALPAGQHPHFQERR